MRYEFKYKIPNSYADEIKTICSAHLPYDQNTIQGKYEVHSLYFDTEDFDFLKEKLDGQNNRFKLRIRSYNQSELIKIEIKKRKSQFVIKEVSSLTKGDYEYFLSHGFWMDSSSIEDFEYLRNYWNAVHTHLISYQRTAFSDLDSTINLRVTIDQNMQAKTTCNLYDRADMIPFLDSYSILELKADREIIPKWIKQMVRQFNLSPEAYSKYEHAIRALKPWSEALQR